MARPSKYDPKFNKQVYKLALLGATDDQFADFFEVTTRTIHNWKNDKDEFFHSIKKGKDIADAEVANSLLKRAKGYKYNEITFEPKQEIEYEDGKRVKMTYDYDNLVQTKKVKKEVAPDTGACFIWLKNRQPDKWRDRKDEDDNNRSDFESIDFKYTLKEDSKPLYA
jgi:hypothetical protein